MQTKNSSDFRWQDLLTRINKRNVIPVIGEGLYRVRTPDGSEKPLYPHLAEKFAAQMQLSPAAEKETFYQVVFRYLQKNPDDYLTVNDFLVENLDSLSLLPDGPLWKLARVKSFSLFINTVYDSYLQQILNSARSYPTEVVHYSVHDKGAAGLDPGIFKELKENRRSLIFNIYGSAAGSIAPAYTEKDILETIVELHKDMEVNRENKFFQWLQSRSFLFMGCRYDDWLFRFFIRTMTNKSYDKQKGPQCRQFIGDDFETFKSGGLPGFLKAYGSEVYYASGDTDFVDRLFAEMEQRFPGDIIPVDEFPAAAFISFHGSDRAVVERLAALLLEDGIKVWFDQEDLHGGDEMDDKIVKAVSRCPVFIPIISNASKTVQADSDQSVRYHIREWEWAFSRYKEGQNPRLILPVKIDETQGMYKPFEDLSLKYLRIPGGEQTGDYEKLRNRLRNILYDPRDLGEP